MRGFLNASDMVLDMYGIKPTVQPDAVQVALLEVIEAASGVMIKTTRDYVAEALPRNTKARGAFFQKQPALPQFEKDCVIMNIDASTADWYRTLFHELAHATGVHHRLGRYTVNTVVKGAIMHVEECIADKAAHILLYRFGILTDDLALSCMDYFNRHYSSAILFGTDKDLCDLNKAANEAANMVTQWCENTALNYKKAV